MKIKVQIDPYDIEYENYINLNNGNNLGQSLSNIQNSIYMIQNDMNIVKGENILLKTELETIKKEIYNYKFVMEMVK